MRNRIRQKSLSAFALLAAIFAIGCSDKYHYEITLRPDGDALVREITFWVENNDGKILKFPKDTLAHIAKLYGQEPESKRDRKHTFSARFSGSMPKENDNAGSFTRWTCPFGSAFLYVERFGGNDDIAQQIDDRRQACDQLVDILIGWLETELGQEPKWNELKQFLDTQLHRDVANLSLTLFQAIVMGNAVPPLEVSPQTSGEVMAVLTISRLLQYAVERGYLEPQQLPGLIFPGDGTPYLQWAKHQLKRRLGHAEDAPDPASLAFLSDLVSTKASLDQFLRTTPEYNRIYSEWEANRDESSDDTPPEPTDILRDLAMKATIELRLFEDTTELKVVLTGVEPPSASNGKWDESTRSITWAQQRNDGEGLPTLFTAAWSEPNADAQEERFGKVVLTGQNLGGYALWYSALNSDQREEWETFLASLKPGPEMVRQIEEFRFSTDPPLPADPEQPTPASHADQARQLLLDGLKGDSPEPELETPTE